MHCGYSTSVILNTMFTGAEEQALESVASSIKTCFGPNGLRALVEGDDGHVTLLHSGNQIFAQNLSCPLMRFIGHALQCHYNSTGDGSKKTILLLTALLKEIWKAESAIQQSTHCHELSRAFHQLEGDLANYVLPRLISTPTTKVCCAVHRSDSRVKVKVHLEKILNTTIGSSCSYSIKKKLKEMLVELLLPHRTLSSSSSSSPAADHLSQVVSHYERRLDSHVVCVEGVSVSQSKVYPGFLMEGEFAEPALLASLGKLSSFKALLLHSDLSVALGDAAVRARSRSGLESMVAHYGEMPHSVTQAVEWMAENNVRLLLCGGRLSPAAVKLLTRHNIAAVQLVDKDLLLSISEYCGSVSSLHLAHLEAADSDKHFSVDCTGCSYVHVGRKRFIHLEFSQSSACEGEHSQLPDLHSLLLCAPTLTFCRQLAKIVSNSLRIVSRWTQQQVLVGKEACLMSVCGGGAWEVALAQQLHQHIVTNHIEKESVLWTAITALQRGLLQIPLTLAVNASSETARKQNTTHLLCDFGHAHPVAISPVDGSPIEVREWDSWPAAEPLTVQEEVVLCAVGLASQLARIDRVVPIRRGVLLDKSKHEKQNSDSENEE